ncbi:MAG TPA: response regulator [Thermoanaerobaculia bacterium]|jgi:DNA-binding response OmpR family regulator|nr:response regulator [Thermoanaerobaculia bacterium]
MATRVLITERDPSIASLLQTVVCRVFACDVRIANDPDAATEALRKESFDLVLLDVGMYSEGLETLRHIRGRNANCEVIALTTGVIAGALLKTLAEADVFAVLSKPFDMAQLDAVLHESVRPERSDDPNHPLVYREFGRTPTRE